MPTLDVLTLGEAQANSVTGKRAEILREYMGYIDRVQEGQAGKLTPNEGETTNAIRRRLTNAATAMGKNLQVRKSENTVYFWVEEPRVRRRGRRPRSMTE